LFRRRDGPARDCRQAVAFLHLIPYQGGGGSPPKLSHRRRRIRFSLIDQETGQAMCAPRGKPAPRTPGRSYFLTIAKQMSVQIFASTWFGSCQTSGSA
jgi:hypothetical protein